VFGTEFYHVTPDMH